MQHAHINAAQANANFSVAPPSNTGLSTGVLPNGTSAFLNNPPAPGFQITLAMLPSTS